MPEFELNKLVRDKYIDIYERDGQIAKTRELFKPEHLQELLKKVLEESAELDLDAPKEEIISEIADIQQSLDDLAQLLNIDQLEISKYQMEKAKKLGGFLMGIYVETIELSDGDSWIEYYRSKPDLFPEK